MPRITDLWHSDNNSYHSDFMQRKTDIIIALIIGEVAAWLMVGISRNIEALVPFFRYILLLPLLFPLFTVAVILVGERMSRFSATVYQLAKFMLVGGTNFLVDLGVLNLLIFVFQVSHGLPAVLFKAAAFGVAVTFSFFMNKFWTFGARSTAEALKEFVEFFVVALIGLGINLGMFSFVNDFVGARAGLPLETWANISALSAAVVGLAWNFVAIKFFVFKKTDNPQPTTNNTI
ncbi:MAG: GtrA family protein [bacterium]|nr:GtrA family protein [bacterium]